MPLTEKQVRSMISKKINLRENPTEHGFMPSVQTYILDKKNEVGLRPMVIVCPGGAYAFVCEDWEGERVALAYNALGFCALTLDYCVAPHRYPEALKDVAAAIKLCRDNAEEWQIDTKKIIVLGFSAAGHLASNISTEWNREDIFGKEAVENRTYRPDYAVLCYPVITADEKCSHQGSFINLTGSENSEDWQKHSTEKLVAADTPPTFIWHTFCDNAVPVESSLRYANALREHGVPFEMHIYEKGHHGLSLSTERLYRNKPILARKYTWVEDSVEWLCEHFEE